MATYAIRMALLAILIFSIPAIVWLLASITREGDSND